MQRTLSCRSLAGADLDQSAVMRGRRALSHSLRDEDGSAAERAFPERLQCEVRIAKRIGTHAGANVVAGSEEERACVFSSQIGHRGEFAFSPESTVLERGNVGHVDAGAHHATAFAYVAEGNRYEGADGRKNDGRVEWTQWCIVGTAGPACADASRTIDVSAFADGTRHELVFRYEYAGGAQVDGELFVDDVQVGTVRPIRRDAQ